MYEIREAKEDDRKQVVELLTHALGGLDTFEEFWIDSWKNYWYKPEYDDWAFIATFDNQVVANLSYFVNSSLNLIRGNQLCFGGVWAVGTDSKHRRKGLLTRIFNEAFPDMNQRGIVLSILDPSPYQGAQLAYEKSGYALAENLVRHEFPPSVLRINEKHKEYSFREINDESEREKIAELEVAMSQFGSRVLSWPLIFNQEIKAGDFYIFEQDSEPFGCVKLSRTSSGKDTTMKVSRTYVKSFSVVPSIIELIQQQSTDISKVEWICEYELPIRNFFSNIHKVNSQFIGTMMMRVINFENYCHSIGIPQETESSVIIELVDNQCPWNEGIYSLDARNGILDVDRLDGNVNADITLNPHQLSMVVGGLTGPVVLNDLGLISCKKQVADTLDSIFSLDSFISYVRF